jgi:DNA-binding transcriptional ArsR family regulator
MTDASPDVDGVLTALAEPIRRRLLAVIAAQGEATATSAAAELPISRQAVAKHLDILSDAGLIAGQRLGREVRYALRPAPLDETARWLARLAADWDTRLERIKRLAEAASAEERPSDDSAQGSA